jgi:hypothetical protein
VVLVLFDLNSKFILKWLWKTNLYKKRKEKKLTSLPAARWPGSLLSRPALSPSLFSLGPRAEQPVLPRSSPRQHGLAQSACRGRTFLSFASLTGGTPLSAVFLPHVVTKPVLSSIFIKSNSIFLGF